MVNCTSSCLCILWKYLFIIDITSSFWSFEMRSTKVKIFIYYRHQDTCLVWISVYFKLRFSKPCSAFFQCSMDKQLLTIPDRDQPLDDPRPHLRWWTCPSFCFNLAVRKITSDAAERNIGIDFVGSTHLFACHIFAKYMFWLWFCTFSRIQNKSRSASWSRCWRAGTMKHLITF